MAQYTENLNLVKPELNDVVSPTVFANNFEIIDQAIGDMGGGTSGGSASETVRYDTETDTVQIKDSSDVWHDWKNGNLMTTHWYSHGDLCTNVTGGWQTEGGTGTFNSNNNGCLYGYASANGIVFATVNKNIDLSGMQRMEIDYTSFYTDSRQTLRMFLYSGTTPLLSRIINQSSNAPMNGTWKVNLPIDSDDLLSNCYLRFEVDGPIMPAWLSISEIRFIDSQMDESNQSSFNVREDLPVQNFTTEADFNTWLDNYSTDISDSTIYESCAFMASQPAHSILGFGQFHLYGKKRNSTYEYQEITGYAYDLTSGIHKWWRSKVNGVWTSWVKFASVSDDVTITFNTSYIRNYSCDCIKIDNKLIMYGILETTAVASGNVTLMTLSSGGNPVSISQRSDILFSNLIAASPGHALCGSVGTSALFHNGADIPIGTYIISGVVVL